MIVGSTTIDKKRWTEFNQELYGKIVEVAKSPGGVTNYETAMGWIGLERSNPRHRNTDFPAMLEKISLFEARYGRPLLSAVVVYKGGMGTHSMTPGPGFFIMARKIHRLTGSDENAFFREELKRVHDFWKAPPRYWFENYWPTAHERENLAIWFHHGKKKMLRLVRPGDQVVFYEVNSTKARPGLKGSGTVFAVGKATGLFEEIGKNFDGGGKDWLHKQLVEPTVILNRKNGIPARELRNMLGGRGKSLVRKGVDLSEGEFQRIRSLLFERSRQASFDVSNDQKKPRKYWIFQTNPKYWDVKRAIKELYRDTFLVNQHQGEIHVGDLAFIWEAGPQGGVRAVSEVLTEPAKMEDFDGKDKYVLDRSIIPREANRVILMHLDKFIDGPVPRELVEDNPILKQISIFRMPQGTQFALSENEARALLDLIKEHTERSVLRCELADYKEQEAVEESYVPKQATIKIEKPRPAQGHSFIRDPEEDSKIGKLGEGIAERFERNRLEELGRRDLAENVKSVSDDFYKGYDILSFNHETGEEIYVEVKSTKGEGMTFLMSANEWKRAEKEGDQYWIYRVKRVGTSGNAIIQRIQNPPSLLGKSLRKEPVVFKIIF